MSTHKKLTLKQAKFAQEYAVNGGNGYRAYVTAYGRDATDADGRRIPRYDTRAHLLLKDAKIAARISELQAEQERAAAVTRTYVIARLQQNVDTAMGIEEAPDGRRYFKPDAAAQSLKLLGQHTRLWDDDPGGTQNHLHMHLENMDAADLEVLVQRAKQPELPEGENVSP